MALRLFLLVALPIYGSLGQADDQAGDFSDTEIHGRQGQFIEPSKNLKKFVIVRSRGQAVDEPENLEALRAVTDNVDKFSSELYKVTGGVEQRNFVSSPISVSMALSMLTYGAGGNTQNQLKAALHFNSNETRQREGLKALVETLKASPEVDLRVANKIFLAKGRNIKSTFQEITESIFKSSIQNVDYYKPEEASSVINQWCEQQTNSKIKDIISADDLSRDTTLVLINAVYFKGNWLDPFEKEKTVSAPFYLEDGTIKNVSTMHGVVSGSYGILGEFNATFLHLPYDDRATSMVIILPDETSGLQELESNLHKIPVSSLLGGASVDAAISLPKFKIESKIDLKEPLMKLGMKDMFKNSADLSGIVDSPMKVDKIVQKAFIEVNEQGTEAAAATGIRAVPLSLRRYIKYNVNRPFYYAIVKRLNRQRDAAVLFHGHYKNVD